MFDQIPVQAWLLIAIVATAYLPARYVYRHIAHSPSRRDITQPREDQSWRTSAQLVRSLCVIALMVALGIFIFTPSAAQFASSPSFIPILLASAGAWSLSTVPTGFLAGRIQPFFRGFNDTYERNTQPKRFWASLAWNAFLGGACIALAFETYKQGPVQALENRCYDDSTYTQQQALSACNELIAKADNSRESRADYMHARAIIYHGLGEYRRAIADYDEAARLDPGDYYAYYNRGLAYQELGDNPHAIADFADAIRRRPDDADAYLQRGIIFLDTGRLDQALADFTEAHKHDPKSPWPLANRGVTYAWKKDRPRAEADFKKVRTMDPSNAVLLRGEALLAMQAGDLSRTIDRLSLSLRSDPENAWALRMRANVYRHMGEHERSRVDIDKLERLRQSSDKGLSNGG